MERNKVIIKIGAYVMLILGIIFSLLFASAGVALYLFYPAGEFSKKSLIAVILFIVALVILLLTISFFEAAKELLLIEKEVLELEGDEKSSSDDVKSLQGAKLDDDPHDTKEKEDERTDSKN